MTYPHEMQTGFQYRCVCVQQAVLCVCVAACCIHCSGLARQWGGANVTLSEKAKPTDCSKSQENWKEEEDELEATSEYEKCWVKGGKHHKSLHTMSAR